MVVLVSDLKKLFGLIAAQIPQYYMMIKEMRSLEQVINIIPFQ
jgi:hypothetical protein